MSAASLELNPLSHTLNVRVSAQLHAQLDALAKATARTKSYLAQNALSTYVKEQSWQIEEIQAGLDEAERGEFATEKEVQAVLRKFSKK